MAKDRSTQKPEFDRAYVANESDIDAIVKATGLKRMHVFCGDIANPSWKMRPGKLLAVFDLRAFGRTRTAMATGVETIHKQGAFVYALNCNLVSGPGEGVAMLDYSLGKVHGEDRGTPERAKKMAEDRHAARKAARMKIKDAKRIWQDTRNYRSWQDAIAAMTGWNKEAAYREIGKRNAPAGRPRKS